VPTLEEYRKNGVFSCTYPLLTVSSLCGMGKIASKEVFDWLFTHPKILASTSDLFRLIDDVASHEVWNKLKKPVKIVKRTKLLSNLCNIRFYIAVWTRKRPCVECCMKQHGVSKQDAHDELTKLVESNPKGCSSIDQVLGLLPKGHQFEAHKPQGHWRLTWSLTSGSVRLVEVRANWSKHLY
jgi:(-)-germacrene D synthase